MTDLLSSIEKSDVTTEVTEDFNEEIDWMIDSAQSRINGSEGSKFFNFNKDVSIYSNEVSNDYCLDSF